MYQDQYDAKFKHLFYITYDYVTGNGGTGSGFRVIYLNKKCEKEAKAVGIICAYKHMNSQGNGTIITNVGVTYITPYLQHAFHEIIDSRNKDEIK